MEGQRENNRRIAKNTLMLYMRQILVLLVALYTSRVVLQVLGVADYGIYNVVGGIVSMFGFLSSAMSTAVYRFYSFEMGRDNKERVQKIFCTAINIHVLIAAFIALLAETVGLLLVNRLLQFPPDRVVAAHVVYHCSIISFLFTVLSVPFSSFLIASERMSAYAWIGIVDILLKLAVAITLQYVTGDALKMYGAMLSIEAFIVFLIYCLYVALKFRDLRYHWVWDKQLFRSLSSHSGWMLSGNVAFLLSSQGVNMLINVFFGVTINAARAVAYQVQSAVNTFVTNFMTAVNPQIVKYYAKGEEENMYKLAFSASKYSFYLLFFFALPVLLLADDLLGWWLRDVPAYAVLFTRLTVIDLFFTVLYGPLATITQANGRIKYYQLIVSLCFLLAFFLSWIAYLAGQPSVAAFIIAVGVSVFGLFARLWIMTRSYHFPFARYLKEVCLRIALVSLAATPIPLVVCLAVPMTPVLRFFVVGLLTSVCCGAAIWLVGSDKVEKRYICSLIEERIRRNS